MPGLCFSNELISRDEGLHCDFACLLANHHLAHKPSREVIAAIVSSAVECEKTFVRESLHVALIGMNADLMVEYVQFVADRLCTQLGVPKLYNQPNPFDWMELISMEGRTNFFDRRVGEYARATVAAAKDEDGSSFALDAEF
jgi:ribonucleoside-diphosphate reductase beta chain